MTRNNQIVLVSDGVLTYLASVQASDSWVYETHERHFSFRNAALVLRSGLVPCGGRASYRYYHQDAVNRTGGEKSNPVTFPTKFAILPLTGEQHLSLCQPCIMPPMGSAGFNVCDVVRIGMAWYAPKDFEQVRSLAKDTTRPRGVSGRRHPDSAEKLCRTIQNGAKVVEGCHSAKTSCSRLRGRRFAVEKDSASRPLESYRVELWSDCLATVRQCAKRKESGWANSANIKRHKTCLSGRVLLAFCCGMETELIQKLESLKITTKGFDRDTLAKLGVTWPPQKGWRKRLLKAHKANAQFEPVKVQLTRKQVYESYLQSEHWQNLRQAKFKEVGKLCQCCGYNALLHVHHVNYHNLTDCGLVDLLVLCSACHDDFHTYAKRLRISTGGVCLRDIKGYVANFRCSPVYQPKEVRVKKVSPLAPVRQNAGRLIKLAFRKAKRSKWDVQEIGNLLRVVQEQHQILTAS